MIDEDNLTRLHCAIDLLAASALGVDARATRHSADAVIHFLAVALRAAGLPDLANAHWLISAWQREYPTTPAMTVHQVMQQISAAVQDSLSLSALAEETRGSEVSVRDQRLIAILKEAAAAGVPITLVEGDV